MSPPASTDRPAGPAHLAIVPVTTRRQMRQFIQLPRRLYGGMTGYVPPLDFERRGMLLPGKAAFYKEGRARFFLATRGDAVVGRISAQVDPVTIRQWGEPIGLFGALDAADDADAVAALLDHAAGWLRAQGMSRARGPYLLNPNGEPGLLVSGQEAGSMLLSPWHPAYLAPLVERAGWGKVKDLYAYDLTIGPEAEAALAVPRMRLPEGGAGLSMRRLRPKQLAQDAAIMASLYNDAWRDNWGFVPITEVETEAMVKELKPIIRPEHMVLVEQAGRPIGVALILPNLYDLVGDLGGNPSPLGWIRFVMRLLRHRFRSGRVILLGIAADLRGTMLGALLPSLMIEEMMIRGRSMPLKTVELGWILEDNRPMRRLIERLSPTPSKVFRLYERAI